MELLNSLRLVFAALFDSRRSYILLFTSRAPTLRPWECVVFVTCLQEVPPAHLRELAPNPPQPLPPSNSISYYTYFCEMCKTYFAYRRYSRQVVAAMAQTAHASQEQPSLGTEKRVLSQMSRHLWWSDILSGRSQNRGLDTSRSLLHRNTRSSN